MSLYLCVFADGGEADGVDAGAYADFNAFRSYVAGELEGGAAGSRFPNLMLHSDCDGDWAAAACFALHAELRVISAAMRERPPVNFPSVWQRDLARKLDLSPRNALECFLDVDGVPLAERLTQIAEAALSRSQPILFQ